MANLNTITTTWTPRLLSVLRIVAAFMFIPHGSQKLFGYPPSGRPGSGTLTTLRLIAGILECFGGLSLLLGFFTRPVAFVLSGLMAVAYFKAHAPDGFWPLLNGGELAALYSFVFLYLAVAGGGTWSLDNLWKRREE